MKRSRLVGLFHNIMSLSESIRLRLDTCYASEWYQLENFVNHLYLPSSIDARTDFSISISIVPLSQEFFVSSPLITPNSITQRLLNKEFGIPNGFSVYLKVQRSLFPSIFASNIIVAQQVLESVAPTSVDIAPTFHRLRSAKPLRQPLISMHSRMVHCLLPAIPQFWIPFVALERCSKKRGALLPETGPICSANGSCLITLTCKQIRIG